MHFGINNLKLTLLLMIIVSLTACAQSQRAGIEQSRQLEKEAKELRLKKDFRGALAKQLKAVELNPKNSKPLTILAGIYMEISETENAPEYVQKSKNVLEKAIEFDPNNATAHEMLADALDRMGSEVDSLKEQQKAATIEPTNLRYLTNVGVRQNALNDNISARETYKRVLQKSPNFIYALYHFGALEKEEGNFDKSIDLFEKAVNAEPKEANDEYFQQTARKRLEEIREKLKTKTSN